MNGDTDITSQRDLIFNFLARRLDRRLTKLQALQFSNARTVDYIKEKIEIFSQELNVKDIYAPLPNHATLIDELREYCQDLREGKPLKSGHSDDENNEVNQSVSEHAPEENARKPKMTKNKSTAHIGSEKAPAGGLRKDKSAISIHDDAAKHANENAAKKGVSKGKNTAPVQKSENEETKTNPKKVQKVDGKANGEPERSSGRVNVRKGEGSSRISSPNKVPKKTGANPSGDGELQLESADQKPKVTRPGKSIDRTAGRVVRKPQVEANGEGENEPGSKSDRSPPKRPPKGRIGTQKVDGVNGNAAEEVKENLKKKPERSRTPIPTRRGTENEIQEAPKVKKKRDTGEQVENAKENVKTTKPENKKPEPIKPKTKDRETEKPTERKGSKLPTEKELKKGKGKPAENPAGETVVQSVHAAKETKIKGGTHPDIKEAPVKVSKKRDRKPEGETVQFNEVGKQGSEKTTEVSPEKKIKHFSSTSSSKKRNLELDVEAIEQDALEGWEKGPDTQGERDQHDALVNGDYDPNERDDHLNNEIKISESGGNNAGEDDFDPNNDDDVNGDPNEVDPNEADPNEVDPNEVDPNEVEHEHEHEHEKDPNENEQDPNHEEHDPNNDGADPNEVDPNEVEVDPNEAVTDPTENAHDDVKENMPEEKADEKDPNEPSQDPNEQDQKPNEQDPNQQNHKEEAHEAVDEHDPNADQDPNEVKEEVEEHKPEEKSERQLESNDNKQLPQDNEVKPQENEEKPPEITIAVSKGVEDDAPKEVPSPERKVKHFSNTTSSKKRNLALDVEAIEQDALEIWAPKQNEENQEDAPANDPNAEEENPNNNDPNQNADEDDVNGDHGVQAEQAEDVNEDVDVNDQQQNEEKEAEKHHEDHEDPNQVDEDVNKNIDQDPNNAGQENQDANVNEDNTEVDPNQEEPVKNEQEADPNEADPNEADPDEQGPNQEEKKHEEPIKNDHEADPNEVDPNDDVNGPVESGQETQTTQQVEVEGVTNDQVEEQQTETQVNATQTEENGSPSKESDPNEPAADNKVTQISDTSATENAQATINTEKLSECGASTADADNTPSTTREESKEMTEGGETGGEQEGETSASPDKKKVYVVAKFKSGKKPTIIKPPVKKTNDLE